MLTQANPGRELAGSAGADRTKRPCRNPTAHDPASWRQLLPHLEGLPLLPCGAGDEKKAPINPATGKPLSGWQTASYTPAEILGMNGRVRSVGTRTGAAAGGLLAFDLDGATAISRAAAAGCSADQVNTWQILRTTDSGRLKVLFRVPPELWDQLGEVHCKVETKAKAGTAKSEQIEVFFGIGQIILAGEHVPSGGFYTWKNSPTELAEIPPEWWALALEVIGTTPQAATSARQGIPLDDRPKGGTISDSEKARACLAVLDVHRYSSHDDGIKVGQALHSVGDDSLLEDWDRWSAGDPAKYKPGVCARRWSTFKPTGSSRGAVTLGTLIKWAGLRFGKTAAGPSNSSAGRGTHGAPPPPSEEQDDADEPFVKRKDSKAKWGKRSMGCSQALRCFDRAVDRLALTERNTLTRRARLLYIAKALGIASQVNRQEIAQRVLEAKDRQHGRGFQPLTADDRAAMPRPTVTWVIPGLIPEHDSTFIGGRPKIGRTRLSMAIVNAVLKGERLLDFEAATPRPIILVTDDQGDGDTADMLEGHGIYFHPGLLWSRHFRLTESDTDRLLDTIHAYPGALVVLDSLRSISRSMEKGENDPEIGAVLYDLRDAVSSASGTLVVIHHNNKTADLVGVEALSGHNAIPGAANTVLTLHHLPDDKGRPQKDLPQRRLVKEGRSGAGFDLVISPLAATGSYYRVGTFSDWQQSQRKASEEQKAIGSMPPNHMEVMRVLRDNGGWMTRRQVCEACGWDWGHRGTGEGGRRTYKILSSLKDKGFVEETPGGIEHTYRLASHGTQNEESLEPLEPPSSRNGSGGSTEREPMEPHPRPMVDETREVPQVPSGGNLQIHCPVLQVPEVPEIPGVSPQGDAGVGAGLPPSTYDPTRSVLPGDDDPWWSTRAAA